MKGARLMRVPMAITCLLASMVALGASLEAQVGGLAPSATARARLLDPPETVVEGEADGLWSVRTAALSPAGELLLVHGNEPRVLRFRADGSLLATIGRSGTGPGEFRQIDDLHLLGRDTLAAIDRVLNRVTILSFQGRVLATFGNARGAVCCGRDGWFARQAASARRDREGVHPVGSFEWVTFAGVTATDGRSAQLPIDRPRLSLDLQEDGSGGFAFGVARPAPFFVAAMHRFVGTRLVVADGTGAHVDILDRSGIRVRKNLPMLSRRAPSAAEQRRERDSLLLTLPAGAARDRARQELRELPVALDFPYFDRVVAESETTFWIREHPTSADTVSRWLRLSLEGQFADELLLSSDEEMVAAAPGRVALLTTSPDTALQRIAIHRWRGSR